MSLVRKSRWIADPIERMNLALSAGAVAASFVVAPPRFAASLALGALFAMINFRAMRRSARRLLALEFAAGAAAWVGRFAIRFALLAMALGLAIAAGANPLGLILGLSLLVPVTLWVSWRSPSPVLPASAYDVPPPDDPSWDAWNPWLARPRPPEATSWPQGPSEVDS